MAFDHVVRAAALLGAAFVALSGCGVGSEEPSEVVSAPLHAAPSSLKTVPVPRPSELDAFVRDHEAAVRLGKALFWDVQASSDGKVACASCHFHAGTDARVKNQLRPVGGSFFSGAPNHTLTGEDYPFHRLTNPDDAHSPVLFDSANRTASQGISRHQFVDIVPGQAEELGEVLPDPEFNVGGVNVRRSAAANAPTTINAVFNFRQLVVGFPQDVFNGVNPWGERDPNARVLRRVNGTLMPVSVRIDHASLASQAVDPPVNASEMSYAGRTFPKICKKLFSLTPLAGQKVARTDSVLGGLSRFPRPGLRTDYASLVRAAFRPELWEGSEVITFQNGTPVVGPPAQRPLTTDEYTPMEANCSLFWGLAIQTYVSTLVADDSHFDRVLEGRARFTHAQEQGYRLFFGLPDRYGRTANCHVCHAGPELTTQSVANVRRARIERIAMTFGPPSLIDTGFRNIGARRSTDLPGLAFEIPGFGPLSFSRFAQLGNDIHFELDPPVSPTERSSAVQAAYKVPGLRNIELTGPYMHNGGLATLRQVVDFFNRGSDFAWENVDNIDPLIQPLGLNEEEKCWLVEFLLTLTDERVRRRMAPFDHPQLPLVHGHVGDERAVVDDGSGKAVDVIEDLPAVGRGGTAPLRPYLGLDPHDPGGAGPRIRGPACRPERRHHRD